MSVSPQDRAPVHSPAPNAREQAFDRDDDGFVDFAELAKGLRALPAFAEIVEEGAPSDGDDEGGEDEEAAAVAALALLFTFDEDSDQRLGPVEFARFAGELRSFVEDEGVSIQEVLFLLLIKTLEAEDCEREEAVIDALGPLVGEELGAAEAVRDALRDEADGWMRALFTIMDADGDDKVSFGELCNGLGQLIDGGAAGGAVVAALECKQMFEGVAEGRDLDYTEFSRFIRRLCLSCGWQWSDVASSFVSALAMQTIASVWDPEEGGGEAPAPGGPPRGAEGGSRHLRRLTSSSGSSAAGGAAPPPPTPPLSPGRHIPGVSSPQVFSPASIPRQMSIKSAETMTVLQGLEAKIDRMASRIRDAEAEVASGAAGEARLRLRGSLAQLWGDLERLQCEGIDAVLIAELRSGKEAARDLRRRLTKRISALTARLEELKKRLFGSGEEDVQRMI